MKKNMKKNLMSILLVLALTLTAGAALAEETSQREAAIAAAQASLPNATIDYAVRERENGYYEWNIFFTEGDQLGQCKVREGSGEVRRIERFNASSGALNAKEAMEKLQSAKGSLTITDLELDWDDGQLRYDGDAELGGRRYEFDITVGGRITEWERD